MHRAHVVDHALQEFAGLLNRCVRRSRALGHGTASADDEFGAVLLEVVQRLAGPVHVEGVARVQRGFGLHQIARKHGLGLFVPDDDVACRVTTAFKTQIQLAAIAAQIDFEVIFKSLSRPCQTGNAFRLLEQTGHAAIFAVPVLLAALFDQLAGGFAGNDVLGVKSRCAQHAHSVVVGQDQVLDGLLRVLAQLDQPVTRGSRSGSGLDGDDEVFAFKSAHIGVAFGREGIDAIGQNFQGFFFGDCVSRRCERLCHGVLLESR